MNFKKFLNDVFDFSVGIISGAILGTIMFKIFDSTEDELVGSFIYIGSNRYKITSITVDSRLITYELTIVDKDGYCLFPNKNNHRSLLSCGTIKLTFCANCRSKDCVYNCKCFNPSKCNHTPCLEDNEYCWDCHRWNCVCCDCDSKECCNNCDCVEECPHTFCLEDYADELSEFSNRTQKKKLQEQKKAIS